MNTMASGNSSSCRRLIGVWLRRIACGLAFTLLLSSAAQAETGHWKSKTKGPFGQLSVFFPTPTADSGSPTLLIVPLLGPQRLLLPGGKLLVWVGRNDGTALAAANVTFRVPSPGNELVNGSNRATEVMRRTNADGIVEVFLTPPDIPPNSSNGSNANNGGGGSEGGGPVAS